MKRILSLMLCILLCLPCAVSRAEGELTVVHATDMHFLSPGLTDYGDYFMFIIGSADGKVTHYTPQLMQAFVEDMLHLNPDAVILTGDLTLNGAPQSHAELAALLMPLVDAGIPVFALPGNHDCGAPAYRFDGEDVAAIEGTADEEIDGLYAAFGYDRALSRDASSMSYIAAISPDVWCLMLDVNANGTAGTINKETFAWIREQLSLAQQAGVTVISATHQPLLTHNRLFTIGYSVSNGSQLLMTYEEYGIPLNLCGHLHMQHIVQTDSFVEIAASALSVSPNQYGVLRFENGHPVDYAMRQTDVSGWAARSGQSDPNLLDFPACSAAFFDDTTIRQTSSMYPAGVSAQEQQQMTDFAVTLNAQYFSGRRTLTMDDPAWALWEKHMPGSFFVYYMRSILEEPLSDMSHYDFIKE